MQHHAPSPQPPPSLPPPPPQPIIPQIIHPPPPDHHAPHHFNQVSCGCCGGTGGNGAANGSSSANNGSSSSSTGIWQATPITDASILPTLSLPLMPAFSADFGQLGPTATIFTTSNGYAISAPIHNNNNGNNGGAGGSTASSSSNHLCPPGAHSPYQQQQQGHHGLQQQHQHHHHPNCVYHQMYHPSPQTVTEALNSTPTQILDPEETYVCCAYTPRCFLIQKVRSLVCVCVFGVLHR